MDKEGYPGDVAEAFEECFRRKTDEVILCAHALGAPGLDEVVTRLGFFPEDVQLSLDKTVRQTVSDLTGLSMKDYLTVFAP